MQYSHFAVQVFWRLTNKGRPRLVPFAMLYIHALVLELKKLFCLRHVLLFLVYCILSPQAIKTSRPSQPCMSLTDFVRKCFMEY